MNTKNITDHIGIVAACACVFHCVALPVLLVTNAMATNDTFHVWSLLITVLVTGHALWHGYKEHCKHIVVALGGLGMLSLLGGVAFHYFGHDHSHHSFSSAYGPQHDESLFMTHGEAVITVIGSLLIVTSHWFNMKLKKACCKS